MQAGRVKEMQKRYRSHQVRSLNTDTRDVPAAMNSMELTKQDGVNQVLSPGHSNFSRCRGSCEHTQQKALYRLECYGALMGDRL